MLRNIAVSAGLILLLPACSLTTPVTGSQYVSADGAIKIRGELVDSSDVKIFVNDAKVIEDRVSLLSGEGEFAGNFQGKPVHATCATPSGRRLGATCTVAVAGKRVTLKL